MNNQGCICYRQPNLARIHDAFKYLIPVLIGLLQVEYQSKRLSPFDTHPINMWIFLGATCSYCLGLCFENEFQNKFIHGVILSSGALTSISLVSIFLPRLLGWLCLGLWTVLPIALARHLIKQIYVWLKHEIKEKFFLTIDKLKRFWEVVSQVTMKNQLHLPQ
ncbi:hypothetical protein Dsin_026401 [Dipteronia sinensis]|uniref:Uncharacterized protein n=1 Tax=Dipteronia sinensis TaxID=43782 RepID=A0AAE0DY29_9ROSI|nr:hypothetical protein Dsin_026401 [Dipteronia sinensis]